jgi:hypothetical protein
VFDVEEQKISQNADYSGPAMDYFNENTYTKEGCECVVTATLSEDLSGYSLKGFTAGGGDLPFPFDPCDPTNGDTLGPGITFVGAVDVGGGCIGYFQKEVTATGPESYFLDIEIDCEG